MFYLNGNYFDGTCPQLNPAYQSLLEEVNNDNWVGLQPNETSGVLFLPVESLLFRLTRNLQ